MLVLLQITAKENVHRHDKDIILDFEDNVNMTVVNKGEDIWDTQLFTQIISKLGLDNKRNITSDDIRYFLNNIVGAVAKGDYSHIIQDIFDNFIKQFPDLNNIKSLKELPHQPLIKTIKSYFVKEPTFWEKVTNKADNGWHTVMDFFRTHFTPKTETTDAVKDFFRDVLIKLNLADKKTLARDDVRRVLVYIIGDKILGGTYKKEFDNVINDILKTIPDSLIPADLIRYLSTGKFMKTLYYYFQPIPQVWENLKYSVGKQWHEVPEFLSQAFNTVDFWESDKFKNILTTLGLDKVTEFTKDDIRNIIISIVGEDTVKGRHAQIFKTIFDKFMESLPDKIKLADLKNVLPEDNFLRVVMKHFEHEPTYTERFKDSIGLGWENMKKFFSSFMVNNRTGWESPIFNETIEKLGWKEDRRITKDDVKQFLNQILGTRLEENTMFGELFDLFLKDFPDKMELKDLKDYLNHNRFFETAKSFFVREPTVYEKFTNFFSNSWDTLGKFFRSTFHMQSDTLRMRDVIKKLGLTTDKSLTLDNIKDIVINMVGTDVWEKQADFWNDAWKYISRDLPDKLSLDELDRYVNREGFIKGLMEYMEDKYPRAKDYLVNLKDVSWTELPEVMTRFFSDTDLYCVGPECADQFWRKSTYDRAFRDLKFDKKDELSRRELKSFIIRVFFDTNKDVKLTGIVDEIFDVYVDQIPEPIRANNVQSYLSFNRFIDAAKLTAEKHFGKSGMARFRDFFAHPQRSVRNILHNVFNFTKSKEDL